MKRILLTGGGTAGHVTPNLALLPRLKADGWDIHYVGSKAGMERALVEREKIPYHAISAGKLRRYLDFRNFTDLFRIKLGFFQALILLARLRPQVLFSKGGFVSCPVVWAAWVLRIPAVIHESDITPGLANRLCIPFARRICYSFPETGKHLPVAKAVHTGIPVRRELLDGMAHRGREICGFTNTKPVVMVIGGSLGAGAINRAVRDALADVLPVFNVCHICGKGNIDSTATSAGYRQFEYVHDDLPHIFACADVVLSRAGATTLFELLALKKPHVLIPLPLGASRGDQILNARSFERQGFSVVLPQEKLSAATLVEKVGLAYEKRESFIRAIESARMGSGVDGVMGVIGGV